MASNEYNKFMKAYNLAHECCPQCGSKMCTTSLVGYLLDLSKKDDYKDLNKCSCYDCGDKHIMHERVPFLNEVLFFKRINLC
jgi:hypothetical protein